MPACTLADCNVGGGRWKSPGDTTNFLASLSVSRAAMVSAVTSLGLLECKWCLNRSAQVFAGPSQLNLPTAAFVFPGAFLPNQTVFPFAGGEQGAGLQIVPDKDLEQAGDHDDNSARGNDPGHCDTNWHRRQHPQHHRSVLFTQERVAVDQAPLRAQVSLHRVLGRSRLREALQTFSCTIGGLAFSSC